MTDHEREALLRAHEQQLPAVWRRPEREVPLAFDALSDLQAGSLSPRLLRQLRGQVVYERVAPHDPDAVQTGPDPLDILVSESASVERLRVSLALRRLLRSLPPMDAAVLRLRYGIGGRAHTQAETARVLGWCRRTVYAAERRAMEALAELIAEAGLSELAA